MYFNDYQISNRIAELEKFYEYHINDQRISKFEKLIIKLKKLLFIDNEVIAKEDVSNIPHMNNTNNIINNSG